MTRETDRDYFRQRAEAELERARGASTREAYRAHAILAGYYFDIAFGDGETSVAPESVGLAAPESVRNEIRA